MLTQNAKYPDEERFRFLRSRDPEKGGVNVYTDHCRLGIIGVRGTDPNDAAFDARGWITRSLGGRDQHTVLEPFVLGDVTTPKGLDRQSSTVFIVYLTFRSEAHARRAATLFRDIAIVGPKSKA